MAALVPNVGADTVMVRRPPGYTGANGGGEYNVLSNDPLLLSAYSPKTKLTINGITGFESFGLEAHSTISEGIVYDYSLGQSSKMGGEDPVERGRAPGDSTPDDPLSLGSAWLYTQFSDGILSGYNYTPGAGRQASATALQIAFWALENETDASGGRWDAQVAENIFFNAAVDHFGSLDNARRDNDALLNVEVMSLSSFTGSQLLLWQDLLVRIPDDSIVHTPDRGGTLALLGAGFATVTLIRYRTVHSSLPTA